MFFYAYYKFNAIIINTHKFFRLVLIFSRYFCENKINTLYKNNNKPLQLYSFKYFFLFIILIAISAVSYGQDTLLANKKDSILIDTLKHVKTNSKAIESKVTYNSEDSIVFDVNSKIVRTYGKGEIIYDAINLQSEYIQLNLSNNEVFARGVYDSTAKDMVGTPVYKDATETFDADSMKYNFKSKQGLAFGIYSKQEDGYLHGGRTKIHDNKEIHIEHGKYTTCDAKCPHFYIELSKGKVIPNDKILFGPAWMVIDEIPLPIVIPFGYFPIKKGRSNGIIIPTVGEETSKGFYFRNMGVYFGIGDYMDLKWTSDIYTLGSWRTNVTSNYMVRYKYSGNLNVGYSSLVDDELRQNPNFNVRWTHSQDAKSMNNSSFSANVNFGSVGYARQNSYVQSEIINNSVSSNISYSKSFKGTPLKFSTTLNHQQNNRDSTVYLTLPQIRLSATSLTPFKRNKKKAKERFYEKITISYTGDMQHKLSGAKMDSTFYTKKTLDLFQTGISHSIPISTNFTLFKFLNFSPSFSYTERWYNDKLIKYWDDNLPVYSDVDTTYGGVNVDTVQQFNRVYNYSIGISCNTILYGMYQFRSNYLKAIRHVIKPSISYNLSPDFSDPKYGYYGTYQKDSKGEIAEYSYFEKGIYGIPGRQRQNSLGFSLGNNLEAKVRDKNDTVTGYKKVKLIEDLSLTGSYNFAADSMKMSDINLSGYTTLIKRVKINYSASFDPYVLGDKKNQTSRNAYMIDQYGTLWRKTDDSWRTGIGYTFGPINDEKVGKRTGDYSYWDVPWNLSFNYNISMPRKYYYDYNNQLDSVSNKLNQNLSMNGKFSMSKLWNVSFTTGWDFQDKGISALSLDMYRDLHCWEMSFNWTPIGERQYWNFTIRVKADMLKDLKYNMRSQTNSF